MLKIIFANVLLTYFICLKCSLAKPEISLEAKEIGLIVASFPEALLRKKNFDTVLELSLPVSSSNEVPNKDQKWLMLAKFEIHFREKAQELQIPPAQDHFPSETISKQTFSNKKILDKKGKFSKQLQNHHEQKKNMSKTQTPPEHYPLETTSEQSSLNKKNRSKEIKWLLAEFQNYRKKKNVSRQKSSLLHLIPRENTTKYDGPAHWSQGLMPGG